VRPIRLSSALSISRVDGVARVDRVPDSACCSTNAFQGSISMQVGSFGSVSPHASCMAPGSHRALRVSELSSEEDRSRFAGMRTLAAYSTEEGRDVRPRITQSIGSGPTSPWKSWRIFEAEIWHVTYG